MAKLVQCKACGKEISSGAKVCPNCGQKQKGIGRFFLWGFAGLIGLVLVGVLLGDSETESTSARTSSQTQTIHNIGDTITSGKFSVSISSVSKRNSVGSEFFSETPGQGGIYVVVDFAYRNDSAEPVSAFSAPDIELRDSNGVKYSSDVGASASYATEKDSNSKIMSKINPGIQINDAAVFEVSETAFNAGGWLVYVDNGRNDFQVLIP